MVILGISISESELVEIIIIPTSPSKAPDMVVYWVDRSVDRHRLFSACMYSARGERYTVELELGSWQAGESLADVS